MRKIIGMIMVLSVILISGCTQTPSDGGTVPSGNSAVCGNGIIESGEECDNSECDEGQYCSEACQCVNKPSPPTLPQ